MTASPPDRPGYCPVCKQVRTFHYQGEQKVLEGEAFTLWNCRSCRGTRTLCSKAHDSPCLLEHEHTGKCRY
jgi:hypothetical protein